LVAQDVCDGLVACDIAQDIYRVALTATGAVDEAGTAALRSQPHAL
jgi:hypothetical protein